jgi:hypothetical protein
VTLRQPARERDEPLPSTDVADALLDERPAEFLARLEAEQGGTVAALDHLTLAIRN